MPPAWDANEGDADAQNAETDVDVSTLSVEDTVAQKDLIGRVADVFRRHSPASDFALIGAYIRRANITKPQDVVIDYLLQYMCID